MAIGRRRELDASVHTGNRGVRYVAVDFSGSNAVIYATSTDSSFNRLVRIVDTGSDAVATTLAASGLNQSFRGLRFGPIGAAAVAHPRSRFHKSETM